MASHGNYSRNGTHSGQYYQPHASSSNSDSGHSYASVRGMGPPPPMEIDLTSRILPNPSLPHNWEATLFPSNGYGDMQPAYASSNVNRIQSLPGESPTRGPTQDPILKWYTGNDGPWIPQGISPVVADERIQNRHDSDHVSVPFGGQYRQANPSENGTQQYGVPPSDSGYGTRRSIGTASVFGADLTEREHPDQDCQSLAGHIGEFSPFQGMDILHSHDSRGADSWPDDGTTMGTVSESNSLICPTCQKPVKTRSELKKHDLRHTKPFVCKFPSCPRKEGFSTPNDLDRHTKSKHPTMILSLESAKMYRCQVQGCKSKDKMWPRLDNFRSHLKRVHLVRSDEDLDAIVRRAEFSESSITSIKPKDGDKVSFHGETQARSQSSAFAMPSSQSGFKPSVNPSWNDVYPDTSKPSQALVTTERPYSENSKFETTSLRSEASLPKLQPPDTVQPREVYKRAIPLENVISSPVGLIDTVKKFDRPSPQPTAAQKIISGKNTKHGALVADATIAEVIRTALAGSSSAERTNTNTPLPDSGWHSPQDAKHPSGDRRVSGPRLVTSSAGLRNKFLDQAEHASIRDHPDKSQAEKNVLDVLKVLREQGYVLQKDPSFSPAPKIQNQGSAASNKSENQVTCEVCKKFKGRPCELKKHMKRHARPYGCTFLTCNKTFGSKNDWKRHENSQHFQLETWRCNEDKPGLSGGGACAKVCYRCQTFKEHLSKEHEISDVDIVNQKVESCRIGRNCQARFWCGFCVSTVDLKKKGLDAWTERFNHIDDHFMGRGGKPEQRISDWVPVNSDKPKGKGGSPHSSLSEEEHGSPSDYSSPGLSGNSPESTGSPTSASVPEKKRPASDEDSNRPRKQTRKYKLVEIVKCCQCQIEHTAKINQSCTICEDGHQFCNNCKHSYNDPLDDMDM